MVVVGRMLVGYCTQLTRRVFGIPRRMRRNKIYRADSMPGTSYCIEMADHDPHDQVAYMTAYGSDVAPGDLIVLREGKATVTYWVKEIDYYSNPSDLWTALIVRCW